jgi:hypothetical protein
MDFDINNLDFINTLFNSIYFAVGLGDILFNILLLYILIKKLPLKDLELRLILFLSCMELVIGVECVIIGISKLIHGYHLFDTNNLNCQVHGALIQWLVRFEIIVVSILAIMRYLLVIHNIKPKSWIFISWLFTLFVLTASIYLYGVFTQLKPNSSYLLCSPFATPGPVPFAMNIALTLLNIIPCWITTLCYFIIGWKVSKKLKQIKIEAEEMNDLESLKAIKWQRFKLFIQLNLVFILHNVDFMPSYITYFLRVSTGYKRPPFIDGIVIFLSSVSVIATPIVTISFQPEVNNEVKVIFVKMQAKLRKALNNIFNRV